MMTIAHLRVYDVKDGQMDNWVSLFKEKIVPLLTEHGIKVESAWVNEADNQFVWIRSYGESEADIEAKEGGLLRLRVVGSERRHGARAPDRA